MGPATRQAYSFVRTFSPAPARELCTDRHYLLCASAGALRLETDGQAWLLPPARAALIEAGRPIRVSIALFAALATVSWRLARQPSPVVVPAGRSPLLRRALELTEQRLGGPVTLEEVAAAVGLGPRSLARRFEEETGLTWRAVLRRIRILRSIELLTNDNTSTARIAFAVGYRSLSAFNAAFLELTGCTPTEYRATF